MWASRFRPILRVLFPNTTKAMKMPKKMLRNVSHKSPIPNNAAAPPNPTIADVLMKVAPYDSAMMYGCVLLPATR
ncbi:MAG: hypothetical protein BWY06_03372 [Candidatus Latescibacteria bacterium ADurb.Bin168]|nr:MAG: hypothetical protein BWY06_03372 [Candidatus Latescibacteria bacterium ADurb.Bin168]